MTLGFLSLKPRDLSRNHDRCETDVDAVVERTLRAAAEMLGVVDSIQVEDLPRARAGFQPMLSVVELVGITSLELALLMAEAGREEPPTLVWADDFEAGSRPATAVGLLLTHITNAQLAIRLLTLHGFDTQARIQLRTLIEFADLAIAVSADGVFMGHYLEVHESFGDSRAHWQRKLRPALVRARLDELLSDDLHPEIGAWRQSTYSWMSQFAHANFAAQAMSVWTPPVGASEPLNYSLGGHITEISRITLAHTGWYTAFCLGHIALFIRRNVLHAHSPEFSERLDDLYYRAKINFSHVRWPSRSVVL